MTHREDRNEIKREIKPQPELPIVSFYRCDEEYDDVSGWCYQAPHDNGYGMTWNEPHIFDDPDQPGRKGDMYMGHIIERVRVRVEAGIAYWIVTVSLPEREAAGNGLDC